MFNFISLDYLVKQAPLPDYPAVLTFDDGWKENHELCDIFKQHRLSPVIYLTADLVDKKDRFWFEKVPRKDLQRFKKLPYQDLLRLIPANNDNYDAGSCLTLSQIKQLDQIGVTFGSHTKTHAILTKCDRETALSEIRGSKSVLEDLLGKPVLHFAYPNGDFNSQIADQVKSAGYATARGIKLGKNKIGEDPYRLKAMSISDDATRYKLYCQAVGLYGIFVGLFKIFDK